jgi:transposase InsO family protein
VLRSYNGGEYASNFSTNICTWEGIKRELKISYNPQQNGVVERKNMAIMGAVRAYVA